MWAAVEEHQRLQSESGERRERRRRQNRKWMWSLVEERVQESFRAHPQVRALLADPELFAREPAKFAKASAALVARQEALAAAEEEWLTLEALREEAEG